MLVGCAVYANSLHGPFIFDDQPAIVENPAIRDLRELPRWILNPSAPSPVSHRPVVLASLALNYAIGELDVRGYHAVNLAVHILCALLIFGVVRRTLRGEALRDRFGPPSGGIALAVALLWMVHPLVTDTVDYVTQRTESIMAFFYLLTLYCAIRAADSRHRVTWVVASILACSMGMASKESMITAPVMIALYDWAYRSDPVEKVLRRRWPLYLGLAATMPIIAALHRIGEFYPTVGFETGVTATDYALAQARLILHYLRLCVWPRPLALDYGLARPQQLSDAIPYLAGLGVLVSSTLVILWKRPPLGFLGIWFFGILAPSSSFVPVASEVGAERRVYLSLIAVIVLAVVAVYALLSTGRRRRAAAATPQRRIRVEAVLVALVALGLAAATIQRNALYRNPIALWQSSVEAVPDVARAHYNLGVELSNAKRYEESSEHYRRAIQLNPVYGRAIVNLANDYQKMGKLAEAISQYRQAIRLDPGHGLAHYNLSVLLAQTGRIALAARHAREAVDIRPNDPGAANNLAWLLVRLPDEWSANQKEAVQVAEHAARLTGYRNGEILDTLALTYAGVGRFREAVAVQREAIRLSSPPRIKSMKRRLAFYEQGQFEPALHDERGRGRSEGAE